MVRSHEVAIIGAGPAGSAAARLLASWGHRVVMLERPAEGAQNLLAESIPPSCRKLFRAVGVLEAVDAAGWYRSTGNTVWWGADEPRVEYFPDRVPGYQVERHARGELLRGCAIAAGAEFRASYVRDVSKEGNAVRIVCDAHQLAAQFALDCSGRAGVVARRGWRVELGDYPRTVALVGAWRQEGGWPSVDPTHTLVESYGDGWAWSVPVSSTLRYVTAMVDPRRTELARGRPAADVYRGELAKARHFADLLAGSHPDGGPWGWDASVYAARTYAAPPLMLVGDAASFVDPLSSYGVKKALASAWLGAVAVHTALQKPEMTAVAFEFFSNREAEMASSLLAQMRAQFGSAAGAYGSAFWTDRVADIDLPSGSEPDLRSLREDERVQRAFAALKAQDAIALRPAPGLRVEPRPVVRGHEVVMEDRLFTPALPQGVRFLRDVDLAGLVALAPAQSQVPDLFDAYNRRFPPVALADFLGALSVLLAFGVLADSGARSG